MTMLSDMAGRTSKGIKYPQEGDLCVQEIQEQEDKARLIITMCLNPILL